MWAKSLWLIWGVLLIGCADQEAASSPCDDETRSQPFEVGAEAVGDQGLLVVDLVEMGEQTLQVGSTSWMVSISGVGSEELMGGCDVSVTIWMPDHGHGASSPDVSEQTDGEYAVDDLFFSMGGYWTITMLVECGEITDTAVFGFCVES